MLMQEPFSRSIYEKRLLGIMAAKMRVMHVVVIR